jgi:hypothetical protein
VPEAARIVLCPLLDRFDLITTLGTDRPVVVTVALHGYSDLVCK